MDVPGRPDERRTRVRGLVIEGPGHRVGLAVTVAAIVCALAGCSEGKGAEPGGEGLRRTDQRPAAEGAADAGATSPTQPAKVSKARTCERLLDKTSRQPLYRLLELAGGGPVDPEVVAAAAESADLVRTAAETAPVELAAQLVLVAAQADDRVAQLRRGGSVNTDSTALMAAGLEVLRSCEQPGAENPSAAHSTSSQLAPGAAQTTIPGDGTFLVGQDVVAGTYRSVGPSRRDGTACVTYASTKPGDVNTYLRGSTSDGPVFLMLNAGEYVTTIFCQPFSIQG